MKGIKLTAAVAITAAAALLAGCGRADTGAEQPASPSTQSVTQSAPTSTARTTKPPGTMHSQPRHTPSRHVPEPHRAPVLANGRHCVFLTGLHSRGRTLAFDLVQWLTGHEADAAFHRDHPEAPDAHVPNDFYIVNQNSRLRALPVQPGALVRVLAPMHGSEHQTIRLAALPEYLADDLDPDDGKLGHNPFWLTVHNGQVVSVVEQYTP